MGLRNTWESFQVVRLLSRFERIYAHAQRHTNSEEAALACTLLDALVAPDVLRPLFLVLGLKLKKKLHGETLFVALARVRAQDGFLAAMGRDADLLLLSRIDDFGFPTTSGFLASSAKCILVGQWHGWHARHALALADASVALSPQLPLGWLVLATL